MKTGEKLLHGRILPGDRLDIPETSILGQNITRGEDGACYSMVAGELQHQKSHVTVSQQKQHYYTPYQQNLVIGRVTALRAGSWQLEINALRSASLGIDSVNLPGLLRVRDSADEASQRSWLAENELIAAEIKRESPTSLNARNAIMGKLSHGALVQAKPYQVAGLKSFYNENGLRVIAGRNGWIWISGAVQVDALEVNSCVDPRPQTYSEQEIILVGAAQRRIQAAVNEGREVREDDIFE